MKKPLIFLGGSITFLVCLVMWPGWVLGATMVVGFLIVTTLRGSAKSRKHYRDNVAEYERRGRGNKTSTGDGSVKSVVTPTQSAKADDELWRSWDQWTGVPKP